MELKEKLAVFKNELNLIFDKTIKNFVKACMDEAPDYIWQDCPSSSSGKYHPLTELSWDGTLIHTKKVVALAYDLARGLDIEEDRDIVVAAALLHDLAKQGYKKSGHTVHNHPQLMADMMTKVYEEQGFRGKLPIETIQKMYWAVCYHYGSWGSKEIKKPMSEYTMIELAVYVADYISSKRFVHIDYKRRTD